MHDDICQVISGSHLTLGNQWASIQANNTMHKALKIRKKGQFDKSATDIATKEG